MAICENCGDNFDLAEDEWGGGFCDGCLLDEIAEDFEDEDED